MKIFELTFRVLVIGAIGWLVFSQYRLQEDVATLTQQVGQGFTTSRHQQLAIWESMHPGQPKPTCSTSDWYGPKGCEDYVIRQHGYIPR